MKRVFGFVCSWCEKGVWFLFVRGVKRVFGFCLFRGVKRVFGFCLFVV